MAKITVSANIHAPVEQVWKKWTSPEDIVKWNFASDDWHSPTADNDARTGGKFKTRMEAKDGSMGFDFEGVYDEVIDHKLITYSLGDSRQVRIEFEDNGDTTTVTETFDAEDVNAAEMQRAGWQAIMDNFKKYAEQ